MFTFLTTHQLSLLIQDTINRDTSENNSHPFKMWLSEDDYPQDFPGLNSWLKYFLWLQVICLVLSVFKGMFKQKRKRQHHSRITHWQWWFWWWWWLYAWVKQTEIHRSRVVRVSDWWDRGWLGEGGLGSDSGHRPLGAMLGVSVSEAAAQQSLVTALHDYDTNMIHLTSDSSTTASITSINTDYRKYAQHS